MQVYSRAQPLQTSLKFGNQQSDLEHAKRVRRQNRPHDLLEQGQKLLNKRPEVAVRVLTKAAEQFHLLSEKNSGYVDSAYLANFLVEQAQDMVEQAQDMIQK